MYTDVDFEMLRRLSYSEKNVVSEIIAELMKHEIIQHIAILRMHPR